MAENSRGRVRLSVVRSTANEQPCASGLSTGRAASGCLPVSRGPLHLASAFVQLTWPGRASIASRKAVMICGAGGGEGGGDAQVVRPSRPCGGDCRSGRRSPAHAVARAALNPLLAPSLLAFNPCPHLQLVWVGESAGTAERAGSEGEQRQGWRPHCSGECHGWLGAARLVIAARVARE